MRNRRTEKDLDVKISSEENKFIPITDEEPEEEPEEPDEKEQFGISGKDRTGRNVAYDTFKKIGANIIDAYDVLEDEKDMETFYDYLLTNLKLYFDKFTNDIVDVEEPTTDEYEAAKQSGDARAPAADGDEDYEEIKF